VEIGLHPEQAVAFILVDRRDRHTGPLGHDFVDVALADDDATDLAVEAFACELQVLARRGLLVAIELRLLEILLEAALSICSTATRMLLLISANSSL
jgi:hypothetical protein